MSVDLEFNYEEAVSAMDNFSEKDFNELRQWVQKFDASKIVPKDLTDKQILLFYNSCYGNVEKIKVCIEKYYEYRRITPEFFDHRVLNEEELKIISQTLKFFTGHGKSVDGYEVVYHGFHDFDPSNFYHVSACKLLLMAVDLCLSKLGPKSGYVLLFDVKGIKFGHLPRINLTAIQKFFQYVQEALPVRMKGIHLLNTEPILDKFLALMKPFMAKKIFDMIQFHHADEDPEKLFEVVPKSSLPSDYGGTLPDSYTLHKQFLEQLAKVEPYFKAEEEQRHAALPDKKGQNTLEGTFRKLELD